jgi:hypothetical protein
MLYTRIPANAALKLSSGHLLGSSKPLDVAITVLFFLSRSQVNEEAALVFPALRVIVLVCQLVNIVTVHLIDLLSRVPARPIGDR